MQVAKLRVANDNGLVPAGRYFAHLADTLRAAHANAAAVVDEYEAQERAASPSAGAPPPSGRAHSHGVTLRR